MCNPARKTGSWPHSLDFEGALLFGFASSSPDSDSSLILFVVTRAFEDGFFAEAPAFDGGLPAAFEVELRAAFDGGLEDFAFRPPSSSSSEANGSSSTFFFLSCSFDLVSGFETDPAVAVPSSLLSPVLASVSPLLDFSASMLEKNSSLSSCWGEIRQEGGVGEIFRALISSSVSNDVFFQIWAGNASQPGTSLKPR